MTDLEVLQAVSESIASQAELRRARTRRLVEFEACKELYDAKQLLHFVTPGVTFCNTCRATLTAGAQERNHRRLGHDVTA